jgi:twitching motility protein PilU
MDFNDLLRLTAEKKASDLFITAGFPPSLKIDGRVTPLASSPLTDEAVRQIVASVMTPTQREEFASTRECNFALDAPGIGRFRISAFVQRDKPGMVLRRIDNRIPSVEELHLPETIKELAMTKRGLILFAGATGTGKSTSLAAMVGYRNRQSAGHIICIEDPIEFVHEHAQSIVTQREVGIDTESYAIALKNTLRQAPDVILIGEIRTREIMDSAIAFAETGHLCLSTVHANNANQTLDRIINFFPEERRSQLLLDLSLNLRAVVAQQLLRRADGKGRIPVVEILINTPLVADLIRKGEVEKLKEIIKRSPEQGMISFDQGLFELYRKGIITYEDALRYADSANEVRLMVKLGTVDHLERLTNASYGDVEVLRGG